MWRAMPAVVALALSAMVTIARPGICDERGSASAAANAHRVSAPARDVRGMWVWTTRDVMNDADRLLATCDRTGTNEVYLAVSHELLLEPRLPKLVATLTAHGLRVEALMGDPTWSHREEEPAMLSLIDDVVAFDARNPRGFVGVHLDVEPHTLPENRGREAMAYLPGYVTAMERARAHAEHGGLPTSLDIPRAMLAAPPDARRSLADAAPRLFLMLYELGGHAAAVDSAAAEIARAAAGDLRAAYESNGDASARLVVGVSVADYPGRYDAMRSAIDGALGNEAHYGGTALHDYAEILATN